MVERRRRGTGPPDSLLRGVLADPLDPGYRLARQRRGDVPAAGPAQRVWLVTGGVLVGLLLGISAVNAAARAPGAEQANRGLAAEVLQARERTEELGARATGLSAELERARAAALTGDAQGRRTLEDVARLERAVAAVPVTGPGLRITVADPAAPAGSPTAREQTVLDRDLQVLVNALWSAGAEAVAIGGVRLHPLATVRQAGGGMLVDNRPVPQPYVFDVLGDPAALQTGLLETDGYGRFRTFAQIYGTEFRVEPAEELTVPAGTARLRLAVPLPLPSTGGDR